MTYACSGLVACPQIQRDINGIFGQNPQTIVEKNTLLEYIISPINTDGIFQNQIDQGNGKLRRVQLTYQPRYRTSGDGISTTVLNDCSAGDEPCNLYTTYDLDPQVGSSVKWSIDINNIIEQCEQDDMFVAKQIRMRMDQILRHVNLQMATQIAALPGSFATAPKNAVRDTETLAGSDCCNGKVTNLFEDVEYEFKEMEYDGQIVTFGGEQTYWNYWKSLDLACCNDLGEDLQARFNDSGVIPFYDRNLRSTLQNETGFLAMAPKAVQLLTYNKYRSPIMRINDDGLKMGVLAHPDPRFSNLLFDYYAELNCEKWNFWLGLAYELVSAPDDMFFADDRLSGVNYLTEWDINNPA